MEDLEITIHCEFDKVNEIKLRLHSLPEIRSYKIVENNPIVPNILNKGTKGQIDLVEIVISLILSEIGGQSYKYLKQKIISSLKTNRIKVKSAKKTKRKKR